MENEEILNYIKRAFDLKKQGCYKQAVEMLYKALSIEPDNVDIMYQLGELYVLMENYTRAIQYPERILEEDEKNLPALKLLNNIYISQNNIYAAKETAEKIYSFEPSGENLARLIKIYGMLELYDDTEKYRDKIIENPLCIYEYSKQLYLRGNIESAMAYINDALKIEPDNENYLVFKGGIMYDEGNLDESREIFERFNINSSNPKILNYKGLFALEDLDFVNAIKYFSKAVSLDKENSTYYYNLGNAYFLNGWHEEAVAAYKKAIVYSPENSDYRYSLAYLYYESGNLDKAANEVELILEQNPGHSGANVISALLKYKKGDYLKAEKILNKNLENGNDDDFTLSSLAQTEAELNKYDRAKEHISTVIKRNPDNLSYKVELCELLIKQKSYQEAISLADEILDCNENYIEAYIVGSKAAYMGNNYEKLKYYAQNILSVDINCSDGYYYLALARAKEKDYEEAIECMKRAIIHNAGNAKYYAQMAEFYEAIQDNKTAFEYIKEADNIEDSEEYKIMYKKYAALNRK